MRSLLTLLCATEQKIEAPVRDSIPDGGKPVAERTWGQNELNKELKSEAFNPDTKILGTEVGGADAMRFTGEHLHSCA